MTTGMGGSKDIVVIGGPNGAGKTTVASLILPELLGVGAQEFINADIIAAELAPTNVDAAAFAAGRLLIERIQALSAQGASFAFETTMASRTFAPLLRQVAADGYRVHIVYMWLRDADLAVSRVADRVRRGGHNIPQDVIRRRYRRGLHNFFSLYQPIAHSWRVYDNSGSEPVIVARRFADGRELVFRRETWNTIRQEARLQ